jgi:putative ABC transport system permease protein
VVITQEMARKYFGDEDPMGKVLRYGDDRELKVTGILGEIPQNSHFRFDFLSSMKAANALFTRIALENWNENSVHTYLLLPPGVSPAEIERRFLDFIRKHTPSWRQGAKHFLQPLADIHLHSHTGGEIEPNGDIVYIYAFSAIAVFILLIACINFMNLSTARSARRAREVGLRKVVGADRSQLVRQFLGESVFLSFLALLLAVAFVELSLPAFNGFVGKALDMDYGGNLTAVLGLLGIALFAGVIAGSYPAFFMSAFEPVKVLKGTIRGGPKGAGFRRVLVAFQFAISIFLIVVTGIIYGQLKHCRDIKLGYDKEHVVVISGIPDPLRQKYEAFKQELLQNPHVVSAAGTSRIPSGSLGSNISTRAEGFPEGESPSMQTVWVGYDFFETLRMPFVAGRSFSKAIPSDEKAAFVLNEAAARALGWTPEDATGKRFGSQFIEDWQRGQWVWKDGRVIGVVKDVYFESLRERIVPMVFFIQPNMAGNFLIRVRPDEIQGTLRFLRQKWQEFNPNRPFEYSFLDERFDQLYRAEERQGQIFGTFALLAIFVACLGLFGLASFTAEQRTKEIGVRKVLGASVANIVALLSKEFLLLVGVANLIAWPVAYYAMSRWLQDFAYRIELGPGTFVLGGAVALAIALLTVSYQAIKAAQANPVEALRYE